MLGFVSFSFGVFRRRSAVFAQSLPDESAGRSIEYLSRPLMTAEIACAPAISAMPLKSVHSCCSSNTPLLSRFFFLIIVLPRRARRFRLQASRATVSDINMRAAQRAPERSRIIWCLLQPRLSSLVASIYPRIEHTMCRGMLSILIYIKHDGNGKSPPGMSK